MGTAGVWTPAVFTCVLIYVKLGAKSSISSFRKDCVELSNEVTY